MTPLIILNFHVKREYYASILAYHFHSIVRTMFPDKSFKIAVPSFTPVELTKTGFMTTTINWST